MSECLQRCEVDIGEVRVNQRQVSERVSEGRSGEEAVRSELLTVDEREVREQRKSRQQLRQMIRSELAVLEFETGQRVQPLQQRQHVLRRQSFGANPAINEDKLRKLRKFSEKVGGSALPAQMQNLKRRQGNRQRFGKVRTERRALRRVVVKELVFSIVDGSEGAQRRKTLERLQIELLRVNPHVGKAERNVQLRESWKATDEFDEDLIASGVSLGRNSKRLESSRPHQRLLQHSIVQRHDGGTFVCRKFGRVQPQIVELLQVRKQRRNASVRTHTIQSESRDAATKSSRLKDFTVAPRIVQSQMHLELVVARGAAEKVIESMARSQHPREFGQ